MRVRAVKKDALREALSSVWADPSRRPCIEGETAWVPVREGYQFDRDLPGHTRYSGRGFYMIGDIAVLHGDRPTDGEVNRIVRLRAPRGVIWRRGLNDAKRLPETEVLWGEAGETEHRECGYRYLLDPMKVMFSQGNRNEKMRIAALVPQGFREGKRERIADMFAGIGYFTIPMAGSGAKVHAMEINPVSFGYLERNIVINGLIDRAEPSMGNCRDLLSGVYDRVVMGHFDSIEYLPDLLAHVRKGSLIHLHSIGEVTDRIAAILESAGFFAGIQVHKVKKYRPHAWHVVQDVTIG
jgi:tRNA wybutosine-synthesizing protein 2